RFCDLMDQIVKVRSERSRFFGPGPDSVNIVTDVAYKALGLVDLAWQQNGRLSNDERQLLDGYVAGFNAFLTARGAANVPGWCAGEPWIGPITAVDVLAYQRNIALFASGDALLGPIFLAQPPGAMAARPHVSSRVTTDGLARLADGGVGSNAWA